ncbi:phosphatase PAP2 family protein [Burkholderiaceae bacterium DAT-1]|nr:phosphatase PAP2 family protein [Burkholderiaceae bacterium DAT-1]
MTFDDWYRITLAGDAFLVLTMALITQGYLFFTGPAKLARLALFEFWLAASLVVASKFAYWAWGFGLTVIDFKGLSGHSMLSAAVYPMLLCVLTRDLGAHRPTIWIGWLGGWTVALCIGYSRLCTYVHSPSEVVLGLLVGTIFSLVFCIRLLGANERLGQFRPAMIAWLVALSVATSQLYGKVAPFNDAIIEHASKYAAQSCVNRAGRRECQW